MAMQPLGGVEAWVYGKTSNQMEERCFGEQQPLRKLVTSFREVRERRPEGLEEVLLEKKFWVDDAIKLNKEERQRKKREQNIEGEIKVSKAKGEMEMRKEGYKD